MSKKFYAQTDALGFPIPGIMMSADHVPAQDNILEITKEMSLPAHPKGLKYYIRTDEKGNILPNSLFVHYDTLDQDDVVSLQQVVEPPAPAGIAVRVSRDWMGETLACELSATNLSVQITSGTTLNDALTITGDFRSLGAYYTPRDPNDGMAQDPSFVVAYVDQDDNILKSRRFKLTAVGVASGFDQMHGTTEVTICPSFWLADKYNVQLGCSATTETDVVVRIETGDPGRIGKYYHPVGGTLDTYVIKSRTVPGMSVLIDGPAYYDTCAASFV